MQIITVEATLETFEFLELSLEKQLIWDSPFWFQSLCVVAFITSINNCSFFFVVLKGFHKYVALF